MNDPLRALENWAEPLLAAMSAGDRTRLAWAVGRALRRSQDDRNQRQVDPSGRPYAPRKSIRAQKGNIRRRRDRMFSRITKAEHLRVSASAAGVTVGFVGRVARIAIIHQEGLVDEVKPGGPSVRYEKREILGMSNADVEMVRGMLLAHFSGQSA